MRDFTKFRKPSIEVLRHCADALYHPTMLRKDAAQLLGRPVVSSQDDGGTQQGMGRADIDRGKSQ
tara:strand:+ start:359 stop:553 length:195 start_codon:yes stop_codon:yes gene_type:complete